MHERERGKIEDLRLSIMETFMKAWIQFASSAQQNLLNHYFSNTKLNC